MTNLSDGLKYLDKKQDSEFLNEIIFICDELFHESKYIINFRYAMIEVWNSDTEGSLDGKFSTETDKEFHLKQKNGLTVLKKMSKL